MSWKWRSNAFAPSSTGRFQTNCCTPFAAWATCWRAAMASEHAGLSKSIALRMSALFTLVALLVFLLIGGALYQQVDKGMNMLPEAELDARYSVLESAIDRFGTDEHWLKITNKLKLLSEEDKRIRFWVVSANPHFEFGNPDA